MTTDPAAIQAKALPFGLTRSSGTGRRDFLLKAGVTAGVAAFARHLQVNVIGQAHAQAVPADNTTQTKHTVCTHCSVGCSVEAVVKNGVWIRQEAAFGSPINMGAHCAKGASLREHAHGEHRLRYPMKLVAGKYQRISWQQAIEEISNQLLNLRQRSGPDALMVIGSSKHSNE